MIRWNVSPVIFEVGPLALRYYSLMFVLGFVVMTEYVKRVFIKHGKDVDYISSLSTHMIIGMIVGARLGHCLFYEPEVYLSNPLEILKVWEGGLASHGGFLGVIISIAIFYRKHKEISLLWILDVVSGPSLFVGGLIRIGNLFNSEIYGEPTSVPWAFIFERVDQVPRHPMQIYEAMGYLSISAVLFWMEKKKLKTWPNGSILAACLIMGFTFRFMIEFLKAEQSSITANFPINMGQVLSLFFIFGGIYLWVRVRKSNKLI